MKIKHKDGSYTEYVRNENPVDTAQRNIKTKKCISKRRLVVSIIISLCILVGMRDYTPHMLATTAVFCVICYGIGTIGAKVLQKLPWRSRIAENICIGIFALMLIVFVVVPIDAEYVTDTKPVSASAVESEKKAPGKETAKEISEEADEPGFFEKVVIAWNERKERNAEEESLVKEKAAKEERKKTQTDQKQKMAKNVSKDKKILLSNGNLTEKQANELLKVMKKCKVDGIKEIEHSHKTTRGRVLVMWCDGYGLNATLEGNKVYCLTATNLNGPDQAYLDQNLFGKWVVKEEATTASCDMYVDGKYYAYLDKKHSKITEF